MKPALHSTSLPSPKQNHRFVALDSWRGLCACAVALFHFNSTSHLYSLPFRQGSYLFVDFFFVLSGFVIFAGYQAKLTQGFGVGRFLILRFGRLYPLHFALLLAFLATNFLRLIPAFSGYSAYRPFTAPGETPPYVFSNLLLIHSLGIHDRLSLNDPSWSVSVEFYTYIFFAIALTVLRERIKWLILTLLLLSPLFLAVLSPHYMDTTFRFGFIRCLFGFSAGALCWILFERYQKLGDAKFPSPRLCSTIEICLVAMVIGFVTVAGSSAMTLLAPFLFSFTVFVFAMERGLISRFLKRPVFVLLGLLSYSIYMDHMFIKRKLFDSGAMVLSHLLHVSLTTNVNGGEWIGTSAWQGDLFSLIYLVIVIAASYVTFNVIEEPCRVWFRSLAPSRAPLMAKAAAQVAGD
jgi:peptidoglycan/LPS O-acetylase OafA/YrhL